MSVRACGRARDHVNACSCHGHVHEDMCWRTQACECECRTSPVLYRRRCSANNATIAELLCPVLARCHDTCQQLRTHPTTPRICQESFAFNSCMENLDPCSRRQLRDGAVPPRRRSAQATHMFAGSGYVGRQSYFYMRAGAKVLGHGSEACRTGTPFCSNESQDTVGRLRVIASRDSARGVHCAQLSPSLT